MRLARVSAEPLDRGMRRLIGLSRQQWLVVAAFVGVVLPLLLFLTFPSVTNWYVVATLAPQLERDLGFQAKTQTHADYPGHEVFQITRVEPGGVFDQAGIKVGDRPLHVHHGPGDFYSLLEHHRDRMVTVRMLRVSSGPTDSFPVEREFQFRVPRSAV